jgi:hypothetical protein
MSTHEKKPRPTMAALQWIEKHTGDAEEAVFEYTSHEASDCLGLRLDGVTGLSRYIAERLTLGTAGRRETVELLRMLNQKLFELSRDLHQGTPSQADERDLWNAAAGKLAPWQPASIRSENTKRYGRKPKKGAE